MEDLLFALNPATALAGLRNFLETGGNVLVVIMVATFFLWALIVERYWYFWAAHGSVVKGALNTWSERTDHKSWHAHRIREQLLSEVRSKHPSQSEYDQGHGGDCAFAGSVGHGDRHG